MIRNRVATSFGIAWRIPSESGGEISGIGTKIYKLCGGKEKNLRQLLPLGIIARANSLITGNYLTTTGHVSKLDHEMIADLALTPTRDIDICKCGTEGKNSCMAGEPPGGNRPGNNGSSG